MNALKSQHHQQSSYFIPKTDFEGFFYKSDPTYSQKPYISFGVPISIYFIM